MLRGNGLVPYEPVQRVIWVLGGLRRKHNVSIATSSVFQPTSNIFHVSDLVVQQDSAGYMLELRVCLKSARVAVFWRHRYLQRPRDPS